MKIALLGYGSAGRAFCELLSEKQNEIKIKYGVDILVTAIATGTKGTRVEPSGIDIAAENESIKETGKFSKDSGMSSMDIARTADYDVLFELTPLDIFSGQPATDHIEAALLRGKHVVSANKGPIAWSYSRLADLAMEKRCCFFYETTVMDGTPIFNLKDNTLKMCKVTGLKGILNSTANYILEELAHGKDYDEILKEGKRRGFVEADPSLDIEGWDSAAKLTALMNVFMDADIEPNQIRRKGIEDISLADIKEAERNGKVIKLICYTKNDAGKICGIVEPVAMDKTEIYATVKGTTSVLSIETDLMGTITVVEQDPEIRQTAYGILSDLIRVIESV